MARENLLNQSRAGPRHAYNEYRQVRRVAQSRFVAQQFGCKDLPDLVEMLERLRFVKLDLSTLQGISGQNMVEGLLLLANVCICLTQCEIEIGLLRLRKRPGLGCQLLHGSEMRVLGGETFATSKRSIAACIARCERNCLL